MPNLRTASPSRGVDPLEGSSGAGARLRQRQTGSSCRSLPSTYEPAQPGPAQGGASCLPAPGAEAGVVWMEARVSAGLGQRAEAIAGLGQVRDAFVSRGLAYDAALATLAV